MANDKRVGVTNFSPARSSAWLKHLISTMVGNTTFKVCKATTRLELMLYVTERELIISLVISSPLAISCRRISLCWTVKGLIKKPNNNSHCLSESGCAVENHWNCMPQYFLLYPSCSWETTTRTRSLMLRRSDKRYLFSSKRSQKESFLVVLLREKSSWEPWPCKHVASLVMSHPQGGLLCHFVSIISLYLTP